MNGQIRTVGGTFETFTKAQNFAAQKNAIDLLEQARELLEGLPFSNQVIAGWIANGIVVSIDRISPNTTDRTEWRCRD